MILSIGLTELLVPEQTEVVRSERPEVASGLSRPEAVPEERLNSLDHLLGPSDINLQ